MARIRGFVQAPVGRTTFQAGVERALRAGLPVTIVYINIERFRAVARRCGPEGADRILRGLGERLAAAFGSRFALRLPADEFAVALVAQGARMGTERIEQDVRQLVAMPFAASDGDISLGAAIGVASSTHAGVGFRDLFEGAETAMLAARAASAGGTPGRADIRPAMGRDAMADELRAALARREFVLHFQPQIDLRSGTVIGAEALVRWQHPCRGLLPPGCFIACAERTGMIGPIGNWVIEEACRAAARWREDGVDGLVVAVNLSACQFESGTLLQDVRAALDAANLPPGHLELELTESILIHDTDTVLAQVRALKDMGLTLSLDDFGTGYSSLSYLKKFAVDKLKIDRSFVSGLGHDPNDAAIVRAIVHMAHSLGLRTIAEGVEDERVLGCLRLLGCDEVQGYYYAPPLPGPAFAKLLEVLGRNPWEKAS